MTSRPAASTPRSSRRMPCHAPRGCVRVGWFRRWRHDRRQNPDGRRPSKPRTSRSSSKSAPGILEYDAGIPRPDAELEAARKSRRVVRQGAFTGARESARNTGSPKAWCSAPSARTEREAPASARGCRLGLRVSSEIG